ncbi:MAG: 3-deoxy-manno-octulosonate cytidylyltransferase [Bacteroidales bacterium]|nr:3-deoxy-manno-octulosonate cytidylyltransferase [Bacteroidales bacterium]
MKFIGIIPARFASGRFPGKPLVDIRGKTMIQRVYEQALKCSLLDELAVATDDRRIFDHVSSFGKVFMTKAEHQSGTDRCLEAYDILNSEGMYSDTDALLNIQGDEPFISPDQIALVVHGLTDKNRGIVTLKKSVREAHVFHDPNVVKVVCAANRKALYFSRAPIPLSRDESRVAQQHDSILGYKHIGLYGFRISTLRAVSALPKGKLEATESLEQLRWLEHGYDVYVEETGIDSYAVDTPEDISKLPG